jgi:hypothetical protein
MLPQAETPSGQAALDKIDEIAKAVSTMRLGTTHRQSNEFTQSKVLE